MISGDANFEVAPGWSVQPRPFTSGDADFEIMSPVVRKDRMTRYGGLLCCRRQRFPRRTMDCMMVSLRALGVPVRDCGNGPFCVNDANQELAEFGQCLGEIAYNIRTGGLEHGKYIMTHSWTPEHLCKCVQGTFCVQCRTTVGHAVAVVAEGASSITIIDGDELACHCGHASSFKAPSVKYILESDASVRCVSAVMDSDI